MSELRVLTPRLNRENARAATTLNRIEKQPLGRKEMFLLGWRKGRLNDAIALGKKHSYAGQISNIDFQALRRASDKFDTIHERTSRILEQEQHASHGEVAAYVIGGLLSGGFAASLRRRHMDAKLERAGKADIRNLIGKTA